MKPIITNLSLKIPNPQQGNRSFNTEIDNDAGVLLNLLMYRNFDWYFVDIFQLCSFYDVLQLLGQTDPLEYPGWNIMHQLLQL